MLWRCLSSQERYGAMDSRAAADHLLHVYSTREHAKVTEFMTLLQSVSGLSAVLGYHDDKLCVLMQSEC